MLRARLTLLLGLAAALELSHYQRVRQEVREESQGAPVLHPHFGYPPAPGLESGEPFAVLRRMIDQAEAQFRAWPSPAPALWVLAQHRTQHSAQHQPQHPAQHQVQHSSSVPCSRSADSIRLSIRCDVTGFRPQDLHVRLGASVLTLSGQRAASSAGPQLQLRETLWVPAAEFDQQKVRSYMEGSWLNVVVPRHSAGAHNSTEIPIQVS